MAGPDDETRPGGPVGSGSSGPGRGSSGDSDYDWLYAGRGQSPDSSDHRSGGDAGVPISDHTAVMPTMGPPPDGSRDAEAPVRPAAETRDDLPPLDAPPRGPIQGSPPPPSARQPGGSKGSGGRRRRFRIRWVLLVLLAWLVFLVAVPIYAWNSVSRVSANPAGDRPGQQPGTTYLVVGSDARKGLAGQRTDTIMLLHTGSGPNLLMSIPRDSQVEVPGYGVTKINAAFAFGGPKLLVQTIEANTGIRVDDYVEIGFTGFVSLVDAVGGVTICPETALKDPDADLDIKKGCQEADGKTALGYSRSRKTQSLGDIDRARHQREVVSAIGAKILSPWTVLNPVRYFNVVTGGAESVRVGRGMGVLSSAQFARAMTRVDGQNGLTCGVPIVDLAVTWDPERAPELFELIAADRTDEVTRQLCRPDGLLQQ